MRLLCDTHILLWAAAVDRPLSARVQDMIRSAEERWFSVASLWEVAVKRSRYAASFPYEAALLRQGLLDGGYEELAVTGSHVLTTAGLPAIHGDPFDRMLIAQARSEGLTLMTVDRTLSAYGPPVHLV